MSKYNEMPKGDNRSNPAEAKEKFDQERASEKRDDVNSSKSQDARRHEESAKHGKR